MNITDLENVLHEQADSVTAQSAGRVAEVRQRIGAARRRRTAGASALAVVLVAAVAGVALRQGPPADGPDVTSPRPLAPTEVFRDPIAGRTLEAAAVTQDGSPAAITVDTDLDQTWISAACQGSGRYWFNVVVDRRETQSGQCADNLGDPGASGGVSAVSGGAGPHQIEAYLSTSSFGAPATTSGVTLAVAAYRLPAPTGTLAGGPLHPLMDFGGHDYAVSHTAESEPGARTYTSAESDMTEQSLVTVRTSGGAGARGTVRVLANGVQHVSNDVGGEASFLVGGAGESVTVEVLVSDDAPPDTQIGVIWSTRVR